MLYQSKHSQDRKMQRTGRKKLAHIKNEFKLQSRQKQILYRLAGKITTSRQTTDSS